MKFDDLLKNQKSFLEVLEEAPASEFDFRSPIKELRLRQRAD